jgi:prevent-host-death family protein
MATNHYGIDQARANLPTIAAQAAAGQTSVITRHGKAIAAVVPIATWAAANAAALDEPTGAGVLALQGTGRGLWGKHPGQAVADLRDEWAS